MNIRILEDAISCIDEELLNRYMEKKRVFPPVGVKIQLQKEEQI